jgi:hypothetical protein
MVKELQRHNETGPTKNNTDHLMAMIESWFKHLFISSDTIKNAKKRRKTEKDLSQGKENKIKGSLLGAYPISFLNFNRVITILLCTLFTTFSASFIFSEVHKVASAKTYQGCQ